MTKDEIVEDLHRKILTEWPVENRNAFFLAPYGDEHVWAKMHHGFGMWIRNNYELWNTPWTPEIRDGVDYSPDHPDSISMTIIKEVWKKGYDGGKKS